MRYLLDTNICIYIIKKKPSNVIEKFESMLVDEIALSSITVAELMFGVENSQKKEQNREALYEFLLPFNILDFDISAAARFAQIRADLQKKGSLIGSMDMLIAAHALSRNLTIVTNNEKEFFRVQGLDVVNWVK